MTFYLVTCCLSGITAVFWTFGWCLDRGTRHMRGWAFVSVILVMTLECAVMLYVAVVLRTLARLSAHTQ